MEEIEELEKKLKNMGISEKRIKSGKEWADKAVKETLDGAGKVPKEISEYMRSLALKSVEAQKKKYGVNKFKEMGKKAGLTHSRKKLERLDKAGELPEATLT